MFKATLKHNPAIPGVVSRTEPDYLTIVETKAHDELNQRNINRQSIARMMQMLNRAGEIQRGNEQRLVALANRVIRNFYGSILEAVELDLRLVEMGNVMDETPRNEDVLVQPPPPDQQEEMAEEAKQKQQQRQEEGHEPINIQQELTDEDLALEVHKRKLINNIIQGEGKNTHRLIHHPDVRAELDQIHPELFNLYDGILRIAEYLDWTMDPQDKLHMMENAPQGFGGFVSVDWKKGEFEKTEWSKDNDEEGSQNGGEIPEENAKVTPVITAVGVDFPMLIHESVKGIYELLSSKAIPQDAHVAETVMMNTDTLKDEIEDLRYGPFIAGDLRDFINENPTSNDVVNLREHVYGRILDLPTNEFIQCMKGILLKTPQTRRWIDENISEIAAEIRQNELDLRYYESEVEASSYAEKEKDDDDGDTLPEPGKEIETLRGGGAPPQIDYGSLTKDRLQKLLNDALDNGDFATVGEISKYLK